MKQSGYHGGDALIDALVAHGARLAFGVPGESYLAALDAMHEREDELRFITCRHEAGAANMAEAYGKISGKPGLQPSCARRCMVHRFSSKSR